VISLFHFKHQFVSTGIVLSVACSETEKLCISEVQLSSMSAVKLENLHRSVAVGIQHVLDYLRNVQAQNPNFYYSIQDVPEHHNPNIFWADASCRMNYTYFGDTVILDTSFHSNQYKVPFVTFTGINHHGQPVLFGCALIYDESAAGYMWLIQTWLHAMSGHHPISITTEPDKFIQMAVSQTLPQTRHRYCKWSIFRETEENLADLYQSYPTFETEFRNCVCQAETINDFESRWGSLLGQYYLMDNQWLQSIFNSRHQWVPVYLHNTFFGELSLIEGNDGKALYFNGFITASTTIDDLFEQYEKAVAIWVENELKADDDTRKITPILKTPSPMEKQAANVYTRKIFMKFQDEFVGTLSNQATKIEETGSFSTYQVANFGEDRKGHIVHFDVAEMKANCSCQMHILSVFRAKNVFTLPTQYFHKRWTRNAKSGAVLDEHSMEDSSNSHESLAKRQDNLRQEAMKFVDEGAKSVHAFHVAMEVLRAAKKKVSAAKSNGTMQGNALSNGINGRHADNPNQVPNEQSLEKARKIQQLSAELESTNRLSELYRSNLLTILKDMEDQKLKLSVKVQNARLSLRD
ncbi:hypothetical protein V2J09_016729, partial [Rumex salicifolius]